jgi:FkbM family methyltransferase
MALPKEDAHLPKRLRVSANPILDVARAIPGKRFRIVFDVGANTGQTAIAYAKRFRHATIFCFEPVSEAFCDLEKLSAPYQERIKPFPMALSVRAGTQEMFVRGNSPMNRLVANHPSLQGNRVVAVSTLHRFCQENAIPHIDLLKIDTEGHDLEVLRGAHEMLTNIDFIQCETGANTYNRFHQYYGRISEYLFAHDFYLFGIYGQIREWGASGYPILRRFNSVFINSRLVGELRGIQDT